MATGICPFCGKKVDKFIMFRGDVVGCRYCCGIHVKQTNADRIRAMTDEELVELFANDNCGYCRIHDFCFDKGCAINCEDVWLDWLRQEGENGKTD